MKIYNLNTARKQILLSTIKNFKKSKVKTFDDLEKKSLQLGKMINLKIEFFSHYLISCFGISFLLCIIIYNLLKPVIGGWVWPVVIILYIVGSFFIGIALRVNYDINKENNEYSSICSKRNPELNLYRSFVKEKNRDNKILSEVTAINEILDKNKQPSVFLHFPSIDELDAYNFKKLPMTIKVLLQIIPAKKINEIKQMDKSELVYYIGELGYSTKKLLLPDSILRKLDKEASDPIIKFKALKMVEDFQKEYLKEIVIICYQECLKNNWYPDKKDEIEKRVKDCYMELLDDRQTKLDKDLYKDFKIEIGSLQPTEPILITKKAKKNIIIWSTKECLKVAEWLFYAYHTKDKMERAIKYCKIAYTLNPKSNFGLKAEYLEKLIETEGELKKMVIIDTDQTHWAKSNLKTTIPLISLFIVISLLIHFLFRYDFNAESESKYVKIAENYVESNQRGNASETYIHLIKEYPNSKHFDEYLFRIGGIYESYNRYEFSIKCFQRILKDYPESKYAEKSLFMIGFINANRLNDLEKGRDVYNEFLRRYPDGDLAKSVKFEIETLGQDLNEIHIK